MVALRRGLSALLLALVLPVTSRADDVPVIVVSPYVVATPIARAGSTVSVIDRAAIERTSAGTVAELLRTVPGVTVTERGGAGGQAQVSLRGAEAQHTLVLIDGLRVNDPSSARADFDFAQFSLTDVERIEILRGPQSAVYGSDAMGGVINIITRRPATAARASATVEGGSYGTRRASASVGGGANGISALFSGTYFASNGFSRVGDRDSGEADGTEKMAGTARVTIAGKDGTAVDVGVDAHHQMSEIDASSTTDAAGYTSERNLVNGFGRVRFGGGNVANTVTIFTTRSTRAFVEPTRTTFYRGGTTGAEYQGHVRKLGPGDLLVGLRGEHETAYRKRTTSSSPSYDSGRSLLAAYAVYQVPLENLHLSFAARQDVEIGGKSFTTGRATAVYDVPEMETRVRGSVGTGAKRPTAFQLSYNAALKPEFSIGVDVGVEKTLFDGKATVSVTGFWNRFTDMIDWEGSFLTGTYKNISAAETAGIEVAARKRIISGKLAAEAAYTYLHTRDLGTGLPLQRRPMHSGKLTLTYTGIDRLTASMTATAVGPRFNDDAATVKLPAYVRVDAHARFRLNDQTELFGRIENLFNATYQEATGYNAPGLSAYAGLIWRN